MNNAKSFIRFTDFGLRTFAVDSYTGNNSAKTNRIFDFEKQEGNAIIQFPFGTESDGGTGLNSKFAVDQDYDQQGVFNLGAWIEKEALNANERKIINQFRAVINYLTSSASIGDIDTFAQSVEPDAPYSFAYNQFGSTHFEIYATPDNFNLNRTFSLCLSAQSSTWLAQWFISDLGDTGIAGFYTLYPTKTLPLEADIDGFLFQAKFYDFDYLVFPDTNIQTTAMPIHSFDVLKFNIIPEEANMIGVDSCTIGLMDSDGNVVDANVGEAFKPLVFTFDLPFEFEPFETVNRIGLFENSILFANEVPGYTQGFGASTTNVGDFLQTLITNLTIGKASYTTNTTGYRLTWVITNWPYSYVPLASLGFYVIVPPFTYYVSAYEGDLCGPQLQLQGTVTIPGNLSPGCYKFYLYQIYPLLIYSFSNGFELNDFEDFTQIISFSGTGTSQGFEYLDDWFQQFRFPLNGGNQNSITSDSEYRDSRGNFRRPTSKSDLSVDLHTSWIDIPTLEALFAATQHSNFVLGSKAIYVQGEIEANHPQDFTTDSSYFGLAQAKFKALIQNYQPLNRGCTNC